MRLNPKKHLYCVCDRLCVCVPYFTNFSLKLGKNSLLIFHYIFQFTVLFTEPTICHLTMGIMEHTMPLIIQPLPLTTPL